MRYLMLSAIGYTAALILSHYFLPETWWLCFAALTCILAILSLFLKGKTKVISAIILFSAALGFAWNWSHNAMYIRPAEELVDARFNVTAQVTQIPDVYDEYSSLTVRLMEDGLPECKVLITDYNSGFSELTPGDIISIDLKFRSAKIRYNTEDDYYLSSGIFLRAVLDGEYKLLESGNSSFIFFPRLFAGTLKNHILELFPEDVAALMKALLTGDKSELYKDDNLYVALRISGLSHIIAVSGMHVSFIIALIALVAGKRRITAYIGIPLVWFFAAMMDFSPSVTRASFMISLMLAAPIFKRENDPPTSLCAALLILLLINPQAIASISLQLSFAAMAGISLVTSRIYHAVIIHLTDVKGLIGKLIRAVAAVFSASLGAMVFTIPLCALHFGYISLYSIITNMLCLWAMSAAFMLAYPVCIIAAISFPVGQCLAWLIAWLPRYTAFAVKLIAKLPWAVIYTGNSLVCLWIIYAYVMIIISWLLRGDRPYRPLIPVCLCLITLPITLFLSETVFSNSSGVTALNVGQGQCIVATTEKGTVVIDCGGIGTGLNAGDTAAEFLLSGGRRRVDVLILTHLHDDHANGVQRLMNYLDVERVIMPDDCENTVIGDRIIEICYDRNIEIIRISENTSIEIEQLKIDLISPIGSADPNEMGLIALGDYGEYEFIVMGDAGTSTEELLCSFYPIDETELLFVGHHGSKSSTGDVLLDNLKPETAIISVGTNSYGHPTEEVLNRLEDYGAEICRTDLNGNITITVGND